MLQSSNKYSATASVLSEFLPVMDTLIQLREKYGDDDFGKQYNSLPGAIKTGFSVMGTTDFTVATGDKVDTSRMVVMESEYSDTLAKDIVVRPLAIGMELQGNVIRMAEVVASLGKEPEASSVAAAAVEDKPADAEAATEDEATSSSSDV
jgi:molecular chaperone GrpE (heat shock protein)